MKIIVGLGNPGKKYEDTRHNIGFIVLDNFAKKNNTTISKKKFNGLYEKMEYNNETVVLLKPLSYMNLSGTVVSKYLKYFKITTDDIFVISDDLDQPFLHMKLKQNGSSGGHNGLKNIEQCIKTDNYKRLKIGIGNDKNIDTKNYVLNKFSNNEQEQLSNAIDITNNILEDFLNFSFDKLMNKYN